jgi:hypothetical protein
MDSDHTQQPGAAHDAWENRRLCSDESCIGVIGPDGRCKECGKPYAGEPVPPETPAPPDEAPAAVEDAAAPAGPAGAEPADQDADDSWAERRLCSDESCIGVIGPDGRCKECGKPYAG